MQRTIPGLLQVVEAQHPAQVGADRGDAQVWPPTVETATGAPRRLPTTPSPSAGVRADSLSGRSSAPIQPFAAAAPTARLACTGVGPPRAEDIADPRFEEAVAREGGGGRGPSATTSDPPE